MLGHGKIFFFSAKMPHTAKRKKEGPRKKLELHDIFRAGIEQDININTFVPSSMDKAGLHWTPKNGLLNSLIYLFLLFDPLPLLTQLNSVLGKGAYKIVYKGIDREEGYEVAWNCFQTTKQEYAELSQEVEILKRVRHPNIINFHDCWYSNTEFIFITELMTSGTLRE